MKKTIAVVAFVVVCGVFAGCSSIPSVPGLAIKSEQTLKQEEALKKEEAMRNEERIKNDAIRN